MRDGPSWNSSSSGAQVRFEMQRRAHAAQAAFRGGHRQAAIAHIVRGFRQARRDDLAHGVVHPLFVIHIERRRQAPQLVQNHLGIFRAAEADLVAIAQAAQQNDRAGRRS